MKLLYLLIISILVLIYTSCDDDNGLNVDPTITPCEYTSDFTGVVDTCITLDWGSGGIQATTEANDINFFRPFLRPQFGNENFAYIRSEKDPDPTVLQSAVTIWQHDLCKGESFLVNPDLDVSSFNHLDISENNWIVFSATSGQQLYKMKVNGDGLTELLPGMKCTFPIWLDEGENILCNCRFENPISFLNIILNSEGDILDTMNLSTGNYDLLSNRVAGLGTIDNITHIGYLDLDNEEFVGTLAWPLVGACFVIDVAWLDESNILWTDCTGIHQVNIDTGVYTSVKEVCGNVDYVTFSVIPHQNEIIIHFRNSWNIEPNTVFSENEIVHFNLETGEERYIDLE